MNLTDKQLLIILGVGVFGLWYAKRKAGDVLNAINPVNSNNVFYTGVNSVGGALSGTDDFSLGAWIYDVSHDEVIN